MKIETKFEVGQKVFIISMGNIQEKVINKISIESYVNITHRLKTYIRYIMEGGLNTGESEVFATKEDAVVEWLSQQNIDILIIKGKI